MSDFMENPRAAGDADTGGADETSSTTNGIGDDSTRLGLGFNPADMAGAVPDGPNPFAGADVARAALLTELFGRIPAADAVPGELEAWMADAAAANLHLLFIAPGDKTPVDMRTATHQREDNRRVQEEARQAGKSGWDRVTAKSGAYTATTDIDRLFAHTERYRATFPGQPVNLGIAVGPSGLLAVDVDTADQAKAFRARMAEAEDYTPTVTTPGKCNADGTWAHKDGGHYYYVIPDGVEAPGVRKLGDAGDIKSGPGTYLVIPPSVRAEGPYTVTGPVRCFPDALASLVAGLGRDRAPGVPQGERSPLGVTVDQWAAAVEWDELLAPKGWTPANTANTCGCPNWTAPGDHASPKSATAHGEGCSLWEGDPRNFPLHIWTDNPGPDIEAWLSTNGDKKTLSKFQFVTIEWFGGNQGDAMSALLTETGGGADLGFDGVSAAADPMVLPRDFWERRGFLRHVRDSAWANDEAPHGLLLAVLATLSATVSPSVRVRTGAKRGSLPLNMFVGLAATSGAGKSSMDDAAADLLDIINDPLTPDLVAPDEVPRVLGVGSGQGVAEAYMGVIHGTDTKTGKPTKTHTQVRHKVLMTSDEGGEMVEIMGQRGSILAPVLRSAWSGKMKGQANATQECHREIGEFVLGLIIVFQREALARLLADGERENGTPQRFLFGSVKDPFAPDIDDAPDDPGQLTVDLREVREITVVPELTRMMKLYLLERRRGTVRDPQLASQRLAMLSRVAALLVILDGRTVVDTEDWALAEMLFACSLAVQEDAAEWAREQEERKQETRVSHAATVAMVQAAAVNTDSEPLERFRKRILGYLEREGGAAAWTGRDGIHKRFRSAERPMAKMARDSLVDSGAITFDGEKVAKA
jgi:hypothetical protein